MAAISPLELGVFIPMVCVSTNQKYYLLKKVCEDTNPELNKQKFVYLRK